ncbi:hypothetical protein ACMGDM_15215 [Sphingomonas sp. DT-51]|uniref:hypothetical protein n=1 Tax=Sphingomonas sp. DT-51 TaxID=3396165 RepID=UPI003F1D1938
MLQSLALILAAAALSACARFADLFVARDPQRLATSAELQLGDDRQPLHRIGGAWVAARRIRGDAHGRIVLHRRDGSVIDCAIGYVTPSAGTLWHFRLTRPACRRE